MSSVVSAPEAAPSRLSRTTSRSRWLATGGLNGDFLFGLLVAIAFALVAFLAGGGDDLAPNTWVQGGLLALAAAAVIATLLIGEAGRLWGGVTLLLFAGLAALTYASIAWSVQPANSWLEGDRTMSYLAAFATAVLLARLAPDRWRGMVGAVAAVATVACGYALLAKIFPATFDSNDPLARLRLPFDYWNAVGLMAAMGLPACLWAGSRREPTRLMRALAVPATAILVAALALSFSRGAILVAVAGLAVWFALAPVRLRSTLILLLGAAGGAAISGWGAATPGISSDNIGAAARIGAGHSFGLVIVVTLVLTTIAGFAAARALDRADLSARLRHRIGAVLIALVALIPVAALAALARSSRGFTGEVSHLWNELTNTNGGVGNQPGRLAQLSNSRPHYWSLAIKVGEHHPLAGVGALGFATAQTRYTYGALSDRTVTHAHGYATETFADFGAIGLAISLALLLAWGLATARTFEFSWAGRVPRGPRAPPGSETAAERTGQIALLAVVVTFGVHSLIDWTWFIPGVAIVGLVCAGWLAGRGPLSHPVGRRSGRRLLSRSPAAIGGIALAVGVTLAALWGIAQPLRSSDAYSAAITAALNRSAGSALGHARSAATEDPVSIDPLFLLSQLYSRLGNPVAAREQLTEALSRQPANPQTWAQLGCYDLRQHRTAIATRELHHALVLEPSQTQIQSEPAAFCASVSG